MTQYTPPITPVQGGLTDAFQPAQTGQSVGYSPPPTDTGMPGAETLAAHPNGAPAAPPKPVFWTYEKAQAEGRMEPTFQGKVDALLARAREQGVSLWLGSGFRNKQQQQNAINEAVAKHGPGAVGYWVAAQGSSNHQKGEAADIFGDQEWLAKNAPLFGLVQPMEWESWHWEPAGLRGQSDPKAYTTGPPGTVNPTQDTTLDSRPMEVAAATSQLFSSPLSNPSQTSPGASFSSNVTGGLTDKTGQVPGAGKIEGVPEISGAETRSGNVSSSGAPVPTSSSGPGTPSSQVNAQPASASQQAYIQEIMPHVQRESERTGIPVEVMIVQSGIETGWGTSGWWRNQRNPAGIGVTGQAGKGFAYGSLDEAFHDYAEKLLGHGEAGQEEFVAKLRAGAPADQLLDALQRSPWAAGHYGGNGLTQTYAALRNAGVFTPAPATAPATSSGAAPPMQPAVEGAPKKQQPVSRRVRRR